MIRIHSLIVPLFLFLHYAAAQTPGQLKSWLPEVEGWTLSTEAEVFNPDNLFDRINGAAPLYIENNFREMTSMEYKKGTDYITIQAYRHATAEDAFGMYASERSDDLAFLPIGGEAQGGKESLFFFAGCIYVKMQANSREDVSKTLSQIGKGLADKIDPQASYPAIFNCFPEEQKVPHSETYITSSFIGHDFLQSVYAATYHNGKQPFQLFVVDGKTEEGMKEIMRKYFSFTGQEEAVSPGIMLLKDKYNGDIPVLCKGKYIVGAFNENSEKVEDAGQWIEKIQKCIK